MQFFNWLMRQSANRLGWSDSVNPALKPPCRVSLTRFIKSRCSTQPDFVFFIDSLHHHVRWMSKPEHFVSSQHSRLRSYFHNRVFWLTLVRTFTVLIARPHGRKDTRFPAGMTWNPEGMAWVHTFVKVDWHICVSSTGWVVQRDLIKRVSETRHWQALSWI